MAAGNPAVTRVLREAQNLGARVKSAEAPPEAEKRGAFEEGPRFSGAKRTETGWVNGVFLLHAGRKDFFDTLTISTINK